MSNNSLWIVLHKMRSPLIVIVLTYSISIIGLLIIDGVDDKGQIYKMSILLRKKLECSYEDYFNHLYKHYGGIPEEH